MMPPDRDLDIGYYYDELSKLNNELINVRRELSKKNVELERVAAIKDRFLSITSHDLRSPIAEAIAGIRLLQSEKYADESTRQSWLGAMGENLGYMLRLVEDILDAGAIESGSLRIEFEAREISGILAEAVQSAKIQASKRGIEIVDEFSKEGFMAQVDPVRLRQALANILSNAVKFSPSGGIVAISLERVEASILVRVIDHGRGIASTQQEKLFSPFSTASARTAEGEKNTGLGLFIAKSIVEAHGGSLSLESEEGRGTSVELRIPSL